MTVNAFAFRSAVRQCKFYLEHRRFILLEFDMSGAGCVKDKLPCNKSGTISIETDRFRL